MQPPAEKKKTHTMDNQTASLALAIETSGRKGSVAIGIDDTILTESAFSGQLRHNAELFPAIAGLLRELGRKPRDIKQVYLSIGPGSFTGLRIAVTFAKMLNFAAGTQITAVDTLEVLTQNASEYIEKTGQTIPRIATILDAKRNLFYTALFERADCGWRRLTEDTLISVDKFLGQLPKTDYPTWLLGEGLLYYQKDFLSPHTKIIDPQYWPAQARCVYKLARGFASKNSFADPIALTPLYIRKPDVLGMPDL